MGRQVWIALAVAAVLIAGCGGGGDEGTGVETEGPPAKPRQLSITIDGYAGAENVAVLMAEQAGFFDEAGLEVTIYTPLAPRRPIPYVVSRTVDVSISQGPEIVLAREKGVPIVAVGSLIPEPTAAMIWLPKSKIGGIADLKGKTIAVPGVDFQSELLETVLARGGLTLDDVDVDVAKYDLVSDLVKGKADAIFGGTWNVEGAQLEARGLEPVITRVEDLGVPAYEELMLVVRRDRLAGDPQLIGDFLAATVRGANAAIDDPKGAVKAIEITVGANPNLSREVLEAEVEATLPLLSTTGEMDPQAAEDLVGWMHEQGMIQRELPVSSLLDDDYLPGS